MTLFMGFLFFKVASGLCLYFIASSLWGIAERTLVPKPKVNLSGGPPPDKPIKSREQAANSEAAAEKKAARKKRNKRR
jgi:YidC/Oxa1 family membrane protein insertase